MTVVGFHASHEQIHPAELLRAVQRAEEVGFDAAMCSDHLVPWSRRHRHSGFAWSWLGAALALTRFGFGVVNAPGQRYHPVVVAHAVATLGAMFPGRFWAAFGSGEAINEHVTADEWPAKEVREDRLKESVDVIRRLLAGDEVDRRGLVAVDRARLYTLPDVPPPMIAAAVSPETAREMAGWADGLVTVSQPPDTLRRVIDAYRDAGGRGPISLQVHLSYHPDEDEAVAIAHDQWRHAHVPAPLSWELDDPVEFDRRTADVPPERIRDIVQVSADPDVHRDRLIALAELGFDRLYLHHVGVEQDRFLDVFGERVVPALREAGA